MASPNIVWITLDSVRADHTSLDGYDRETTPSLERVADAGHGFSTCISHGKSTLTSSGAIMTGYAPTRTRVGIDGNSLPDNIRTIPERFRAAGYTTACLSRNSYLSSATNLDKGFDRFKWLASSTMHTVGLRTLAKYFSSIRTHSAGLTLDTSKHASALLMNETAKNWLSDFQGAEEPFFFYLHYNEPHRPYYPPGKYLDTFAGDLPMSGREAAELALEIHYDLNEIVATGRDLTEEEWAVLEAMYDAEIAYTDEMVGNLVEHIQASQLEDTIVVITADHGELFGEFGLLSHSYVLHDAVTRVPLVVSGLDTPLVPESDGIVQHSDVMTTLLSVSDADPGDTMGVDLRQKAPDYAVSQRGPETFEELLEHNPGFDTSKFHSETLTSIRTDEFRYQTSGERDELFALTDQETDVTDSYPATAADLAETTTAWLDEHGEPATEGHKLQFSGAVRRQLRDLGYME